MTAAVTPSPFTSGFRLTDGQALDTALAYPLLSSQDGITAFATGGQTNATQLTAYINRIGTVATAADSVKLPASAPGRYITVINDTANAMQVFGKTTATINGVASGTGVSQPANSVVTYYAPVAGKWFSEGGLESTGNFTTVNATTGNITTVNATTINAGADASAGTVDVFPSTTASGKLILAAVNSAGAFNTTISNASMGQSTVVSIPDPGASTANFVLSAGSATIGGVKTFSSAPVLSGGLSAADNLTMTVAAKGLVLKQGANGKCGTFVCNGVTPVTVSNTSIAITDTIIISLNTVGGTVGAVPAVKTITASTGFTVAGTASDTSTYNYAIISNAA